MKIQLKRSDKLLGGAAYPPSEAAMEYGELAVNYNTVNPVVFIKDSDNNIIEIASKNGTAQGLLWSSSGANLYPTNIDSKIGIGTTTPGAPLTIKDSTSAEIRLIKTNASNNFSSISSSGTNGEALTLTSTATGSITLNVGTTLGAHINSSGNVGIKNASPTVALDVTGGGKFSNKVTSAATTDTDSDGTLTTKGYVTSLAQSIVTGNATWKENTEDKTLVPINIANNVGIGQENPVEKLDVNGSVKVSSRAYYTTGLTADEENSDMFLANKAYVDAGDHWNETDNKLTPKNTSAKVGIGTDNPGYTLQVNGDLAAFNFRIDLLTVLGD